MYETGAQVAIFCICANYVFALMRHYSLQTKNLNKIGMRLSWLDGKPTEKSNNGFAYQIIKIFFILVSTIIAIGLSWFTVVFMLGTITFSLWKDFDPPERIKNFRWKMKNVNMSEEQILRAMFDTTELPESEFPAFLESHRNNYGEFYKN